MSSLLSFSQRLKLKEAAGFDQSFRSYKTMEARKEARYQLE
jgi:hypothetical protein